MKTAWRWFGCSIGSGPQNMEQDRALFQEIKDSSGIPCLRFYRWSTPTLSYGRTQGLDSSTQLKYMKIGWPIVQRPTGGGIVSHRDDLCFSLVWRKEDSTLPWTVLESYCVIHRWIKNSLEELGYTIDSCGDKNRQDKNSWCFQSPVQYDLLSQGLKVIGGAQWRQKNTALHQGSIQIKLKPEAVEIFKNNFETAFNVQFFNRFLEVLC